MARPKASSTVASCRATSTACAPSPTLRLAPNQRDSSNHCPNSSSDARSGSGSTFRVTLLRATLQAAVEPAQRAAPVHVQPAVSRGRVLIIDDDPAMGNAIGLVLGEDHEVEVFTSARRALGRSRGA
jgi:hypothetical protein